MSQIIRGQIGMIHQRNLVWQTFARVEGNKVPRVHPVGSQQFRHVKPVRSVAGIATIGTVKVFAIQLQMVVDCAIEEMMTTNANVVIGASDAVASATLYRSGRIYLEWLSSRLYIVYQLRLHIRLLSDEDSSAIWHYVGKTMWDNFEKEGITVRWPLDHMHAFLVTVKFSPNDLCVQRIISNYLPAM